MTADIHVEVAVIGGGACGLTAALAARHGGADVMVLEKEKSLSGSTSMSSGFIPAANTRFQISRNIADTVEQFADDIRKKSHDTARPALVDLATRSIGPALDFLADNHGFEWQVLDDFLYPGHSVHRMHCLREKTGAALLAQLGCAVEAENIPVILDAAVDTLYMDADRIAGLAIQRPDGTRETLGCNAVIIACSGFGGNAQLVAQHMPQMHNAPYHGHAGNTGEAVLWGEQLDAQLDCLTACQGHGSLAHPQGILITWALMMEGGIQINRRGQRFSNEHRGYSEQSIDVLRQDGAMAWCIFDDRLLQLAQGFPDFVEAQKLGAIKTAANASGLAALIGVPEQAFEETLSQTRASASDKDADPFGRDFSTKPPLGNQLHAIRVTGALFHTQGGLLIDNQARVLRRNGGSFQNLFAGGGAACGVSGTTLQGYLSGNGLLSAIAFGFVAGMHANKC